MKRVAATALLAMGLLHGPGAVSQESRVASDSGRIRARQHRRRRIRPRPKQRAELKAAAGEFTVVTIEPTQWSDSSLGCRKPGSMYTQVINEATSSCWNARAGGTR